MEINWDSTTDSVTSRTMVKALPMAWLSDTGEARSLMTVSVELMLWEMEVGDVRLTMRYLSEAAARVVVATTADTKLATRESTRGIESLMEAVELTDTRNVSAPEIEVAITERDVRLTVIPNARAMTLAMVAAEVKPTKRVSVELIASDAAVGESSDLN